MIQQDPGPGMVDVLGGGEQDHRPGVGHLDEMGHRFGSGWSSQLGPVAVTELLEAINLMPVPAAELGAGSHILEPLVEPGVGLPHPTRPETVDQDPVTGRALPFVDAMDLERDMSRVRLEPIGQSKGQPLITTTTFDVSYLAPKERHETIFEHLGEFGPVILEAVLGEQGFRPVADHIDEETWRVNFLWP